MTTVQTSAAAPSITGLYDALHTAQSRLISLRAENRTADLIQCLHQIGDYSLLVGEGQAALDALREAVQHGEPTPALQLTFGQALCFNGHYADGKVQLEGALANAGDESLRGLCLLSLGRDWTHPNHFSSALSYLSEALSILQACKLDQQVAVCSLALAAVHLREGRQAECEAYLKQADALLSACKLYWERPEWWRLSALLALDGSHYGQAVKLASKGLGTVDNRGDVRLLAGLYRMFATALERNHERIEDARDARHRAVNAARASAPRLELAYALFELGHHYKTYSNRPTFRARGSGYLFEADRLFREIEIESPSG